MLPGTENNGRCQALQVFICDTKSKVISGGSALAGVAGVIIIGLGALAVFGPIGSPGFIGSMTGAGVLVIGGGFGLIMIAIKNSTNTSEVNGLPPQEDLVLLPAEEDLVLLPAEERSEKIAQHQNLSRWLVKQYRISAYNKYLYKYAEICKTSKGRLGYNDLIEQLRMSDQNLIQQLSIEEQYLRYYTLYYLEYHSYIGLLSFQDWQTQQSSTN